MALAAHRTISRNSARAVAQEISLRPGDLPSYTAQGNPITAQDIHLATEQASCEGRSPPSEAFARTQSERYVDNARKPTVMIQSTTQILPTTSVVAHDLVAAERPRALACVLRLGLPALRATLPKNETVTGSVSRIASPISGTDGTLGVRLAFVLHVKQGATTISQSFYNDAIDFAYGQAEIAVLVATDSGPPSSSLERRLAALLVTRARAAID